MCLIPTTIGALLSAIGIAGMDRMIQKNVIAMSGRAVEAAGDVDVLLLDKTGTITLGNRQATAFFPGRRGHRGGAGRRGPARLAGRRDPGGPQHRGPGQGEVPDPRARDREARRDLRALHRADPHERRQPERPAGPQGRAGRHRGPRQEPGRHRSGGGPHERWTPSPRRAPRRSWSADGRQGARRHPAQGHRQGRHPRALRPAPPHGHQDHHDHRRQPAHRRRHQRRGGRGRLPGRRPPRRPSSS